MRTEFSKKKNHYMSMYRSSKFMSYMGASAMLFYTWQFVCRSPDFINDMKRASDKLGKNKKILSELEYTLLKEKLEAEMRYDWDINWITINKATHRKIPARAKMEFKNRDIRFRFDFAWEVDLLLRVYDYSLLVNDKRLTWKKVTEKLDDEFTHIKTPKDPSTVRNKLKRIQKILLKPKDIYIQVDADIL